MMCAHRLPVLAATATVLVLITTISLLADSASELLSPAGVPMASLTPEIGSSTGVDVPLVTDIGPRAASGACCRPDGSCTVVETPAGC
ncbi:MAG TPA: hypothetical protein VMV94_11290, partial [Phycisphaerae bacterium]|nr:hypothetical protein [Phycisphaerae bacterium]